MRVGIIGAGNIGGTLTRRMRALGHDVAIANSRGPDTLRDLATETGARAVTVSEAIAGSEFVVVTIPQKNVPSLAGAFARVPDDVVVVDTGNYYPRQRDGRIADLEAAASESRWVAQRLGHAVVKAFNNIYAQHLFERGTPAGTPDRIALPVAGDDATAKATVMQLVDDLGFDPLDAGSLDESWRQQPGSPVYARDFDAAGVRDALARASRQRAPDWTGTDASPGDFENPR